jgi:hypothetical protein
MFEYTGRPGYVEHLTESSSTVSDGEPWEDPFPLRRKDGDLPMVLLEDMDRISSEPNEDL